jgi:hypothetical protein
MALLDTARHRHDHHPTCNCLRLAGADDRAPAGADPARGQLV